MEWVRKQMDENRNRMLMGVAKEEVWEGILRGTTRGCDEAKGRAVTGRSEATMPLQPLERQQGTRESNGKERGEMEEKRGRTTGAQDSLE